MKITDIKSFLVSEVRNFHVVKVETDSGIYGLGEAGCFSREHAQEGAIRHFREFLVGMDPMRIEHIWQTLYRGAYYEGGRILTAVISAIDIALHDIVGKALGVPVYQLLGGACRDKVYGFVTVGGLSDPGCVDRAKEAIAEGWPAARFGPCAGDDSGVFDARASVAETAERFAEAYDKLDRRIALGIDFHHRLSVAEAASFCQRVPAGSLAFLEEPIRCESPEAYAALRKMTGTPFAIGEEFSSKWAFLPYIERGLANFARVDVCNVGGLTEAKKVAGWCEAHHIDLMPHNPSGPVCTAATVHLAAACNNFAWVEVQAHINESAAEAFPGMPECRGGCYPLPTRPGLGLELDETAAARYPFKLQENPHLARPDGSYTTW